MRQIETSPQTLPVPLGIASARPSAGVAPGAAFLSQLIAERHHMSTQRARRRAPVDDVVKTYDAGGKIGERRMPPGYRMTVDA
jgi:hypothetical protein